MQDWYLEMQDVKNAAQYLGCSYLELEADPRWEYLCAYVRAAQFAEAEAKDKRFKLNGK